MRLVNIISLLLVIIGAINWGLVGFFQFNLIDTIFGVGTLFSRVIYAIVGICGLYSISFFARDRYRHVD